MKRAALILLLVLGVSALTHVSRAQQVITLTTPIVVGNTTTCTLESLFIFPSVGNLTAGKIVVTLKGTNGESFVKTYDATTTPTGQSLLNTLNKRDFSGANASFIAQVYQRMSTDGVCVGSVTGSPQH